MGMAAALQFPCQLLWKFSVSEDIIVEQLRLGKGFLYSSALPVTFWYCQLHCCLDVWLLFCNIGTSCCLIPECVVNWVCQGYCEILWLCLHVMWCWLAWWCFMMMRTCHWCIVSSVLWCMLKPTVDLFSTLSDINPWTSILVCYNLLGLACSLLCLFYSIHGESVPSTVWTRLACW